ncbi:hypothetical protein B8W72_01760 [Pseudomonas putida]|uniref:Uncharacterized protein n=2 Tax=Pseudomonas putida TaxID=303 RepID=A0A1Y3LKP3_PSEPU|nr:hypothetical protein B8W72_01760 [Pseudomonas putida]
MKKLYRALCMICTAIDCILYAARNYCIENDWVVSGAKKLLVIGGIFIAICSAMLWHASAFMQEQLAIAGHLDPAEMVATTKASAMLNTKAAMLGVTAALMNGLFYWLGTLNNLKDD